MAKQTRATLKTYLETNDFPTQTEFADLIDSLISLVDGSNLNDGVKIKSKTNGKMQLEFDDGYIGITSDGDAWNDCYIYLEPTNLEIWAGKAKLTMGLDGGTNLFAAADHELVLLSGNGNGMSVKKITATGQVQVRLNSLGTYADNATAIADGRILNEIYKTATGELRIVY